MHLENGLFVLNDNEMKSFEPAQEFIQPKKEVVWNQSRALSDLLVDVNNIQAACVDYAEVNLNSSEFFIRDGVPFLSFYDDGEKVEKKFTPHSFTQFCNIVGVPGSYIKKCMTKGDWGNRLASRNVCDWLYNSHLPNNYLVRGYNDQIRGILSERFVPYDAPEVVKSLIENIDENQFSVVGTMIDSERFHCRIINKSFLNIKGDDLCWGFYIDSSDVGRGALNITLFIWRQACTNGMVVAMGKSDLFYKVHRGTIEEFGSGIRYAIDNAEPVVNKTVELINNASNILIKDTSKVLDLVKHYTGLSDRDTEALMEFYRTSGYDSSMWGLVNAITEQAQKYTLEKRIDLEKGAGKLLLAAA